MLINSLLVLLFLLPALALQPWRAVGSADPSWPWLAWLAWWAWWAVLALFWGADRLANVAIIQPLSGAAVLTGMLTAIFVAIRPEWLATCSDHLYLPKD